MKKLILMAAVVTLAIAACKTKKAAMSSSGNSMDFDTQLSAIKDRFPDASTEELKTGYAVYTGPCTSCHGAKDVTGYTEEKLLQIVDNMAKKAKITDAEKQALIRFAVAVRATTPKKQ